MRYCISSTMLNINMRRGEKCIHIGIRTVYVCIQRLMKLKNKILKHQLVSIVKIELNF